MKKKKLPIRWDRLTKANLDAIYDYIAKDSVPAAKKVKKELVNLAHSLNDFPNKYSVPMSQEIIAQYLNGAIR